MESPWSREEFEEAFFDPMEQDPETEEEMSDEPLIADEPFDVDWPGVSRIGREFEIEGPAPVVVPHDLPLDQLARYPPNAIDDALLRMDPLRTQRACRMPAIAPLCNPDFWRRKMDRLGVTPREPYTIGEYGSMAIESGRGCMYADPTIYRGCILDALAEKDLDRFRYYMENIGHDFPDSELVGWFAYFAGHEFMHAWSETQSPLRYKILLAQIYAITGRDRLFYDIFQDPELWDSAPTFAEAATVSGSTAILRAIFGNEIIRPILDREYGLREPMANQKFHVLIANAVARKRQDAVRYLKKQARKVGPLPTIHQRKYITKPVMYDDRHYKWSIFEPKT